MIDTTISLCEDQGLTSCQIEHLKPHKSDPELKFSWDNLFLVCTHCNNIKGDKYWPIWDCTQEDVDALLGSFAIPNTQCNIVFFQHTTNAWVKILRTPYSPKRDLVKEINDALSSYRELGILNKMSIANNANNQVEFDELRNTFLADFPICNVGCYDTIVKLDERRKIILDKLYNDYKG